MKKIKPILCMLLVMLFVLSSFGCAKTKGPGPAEPGVAGEGEMSGESNIEMNKILPDYLNPLTGLETEMDTTGRRPVGIMLNNIKAALPQVGISKADVLFECLAEGGITRLEGIFAEYENIGVVGSIRSSRPYFLDFAQMFDAVYCHAGGSDEAYSQMVSRHIDHIDGVRGGTNPLGIFYRDAERKKTMSIEHTMMTTGDGIAKTIPAMGYRSTLRDGFEYPWSFAQWGSVTEVGTAEARHIYLPISSYQTVDYTYDDATKLYSRYQYNGMKHIDGAGGAQLTFTNVIVLFCDTAAISGDAKNRISVNTVGTGNGYLASGGVCTEITWSRDNGESNLVLKNAATGDKITINRGKTFINVCPTSIAGSVNMNATDRVLN